MTAIGTAMLLLFREMDKDKREKLQMSFLGFAQADHDYPGQMSGGQGSRGWRELPGHFVTRP